MGKKKEKKTWDELMDELGMTKRNDDIDNATYHYICELTEKEIEWDMTLIGLVQDTAKSIITNFGHDVCHPGANDDEVLCSEDETFDCPIRKRGECKFKLSK